MTSKRNVLIFPAGSEIGIEIFNSLKYSHHIDLFGASGKSDHASYLYPPERYTEDPELYIDRPDFDRRFGDLLLNRRIDLVYPTHDSVANYLAGKSDAFPAKLVSSCAATNRIARFKSETYRVFRDFSFCPEVFHPPYPELNYPVFIKPDDGQGGKGAHVANDPSELHFHLARNPGAIVMEYLPGEEVSVDCFTDFRRELRFVGPRTRERVQMGISFRSSSMPVTEEILLIANAINTTLELDGAWFFQLKKDAAGKFKLLEFAPRQASTMGLYRHAGVNFALLSMFNAFHQPVQIIRNDYAIQLDRCLYNRYKSDLSFSRVYIDFDETLVTDGKVNERIIAFLYQCRRDGIPVVLLTKHRHDLAQTLASLAISERLFETIIHIPDEQEKWRCIDPPGAIFIDNYWFDRRDVHERLGIPVFDVDAVECLLR